jgi:hypothetical protein
MGSICPQGSLLQVLIDVPSKSTATQRYSSHHHTRLRRRQENVSHGEWQLVRLYKWYVTRYPCHLSSTQTCTAILTLSIVASNLSRSHKGAAGMRSVLTFEKVVWIVDARVEW